MYIPSCFGLYYGYIGVAYNMKKTLLIFIILVINQSYGQNKLNGIIVDFDTNEPIEYVDIYNTYDFTLTNSEGKFSFVSNQDSIKIKLLGYNPIFTTFNEIKRDTIFLKSKFEILDMITLSNPNSIKKVYKNVPNNYPFTPYSETFFLRCFIKKNGKIIKIQDINGLVKRKTLLSTSVNPMPKKNYEIEILNMRKAGIYEEDIYFEMFSFKQIFKELASVGISTKLFKFNENKSKNNDYTKYSFFSKKEIKTNLEGYYIVNNNENVFTEMYLKKIDTSNSFIKKRNIKYKTTFFEKSIFFKKNLSEKKYFIDKAKIKAEVKVIDKNNATIIYNVVYTWITLNQNKNNINKKYSINKDIFKLKKTFDSIFWKNQKYLLLTKEMTEFLSRLKDSNNDYKTVSNIKKE